MIKLSYAITVCNELAEIQKLVSFLLDNKRFEDEIVIVFDSKNGLLEIEEYLRAKSVNDEFKWYPFDFKGDFSELKNYTKKMCSGDYIFHLDADELPNKILMEQLPEIIEINDVDLIWIPRVNTVEGIDPEYHLKQWGWVMNEKGWINYPDYQSRVFRNSDKVKWQNKVHERIVGISKYSHLPPHEELSLYHPKTIDKQEQQNRLYDKINMGSNETEYVPISLDYFLNMEFARGGGGKEVITQGEKLKTVRDVLEFHKNNDVSNELKPSNWQYYNCMKAEFRKNVEGHHERGWENMTTEYYDSLDRMNDSEIEIFLRENPVDFDNGFIKHGFHRACSMIGRLLNDKTYIPFYMEKEKVFNKPWKNDNKIRTNHPLKLFNYLDELNKLDNSHFCLTQSSILTLMGIRPNDDLDIIISSTLRNKLQVGNEYLKTGHVEIFSPNYDKFMIFGVNDDDDLIKNYTFEFEGLRFLEPRFYLSRKNRETPKDKSDWEGIIKFIENENHKGYPFHNLTEEQLGLKYL